VARNYPITVLQQIHAPRDLPSAQDGELFEPGAIACCFKCLADRIEGALLGEDGGVLFVVVKGVASGQ
jgi:hypothetical protein